VIIIVIIIISVIIMSVCSFIVKLFFGLSHDDSVFNSLTLKVFLYYILMLHVSYKERQVYHAICKYMCVCVCVRAPSYSLCFLNFSMLKSFSLLDLRIIH